jgi:Molecular chaperone (small heat shock protein)
MDNKEHDWIDVNKGIIIKIPKLKFICGPAGIIIKKISEDIVGENYHIEEYPDRLELFVEMPGAKKDSIEIYSTERIVYIKAKLERKLPYRSEDYEFKIKLPYEIIPEESKAKYENGILNITLKRKVTPTKIKVD